MDDWITPLSFFLTAMILVVWVAETFTPTPRRQALIALIVGVLISPTVLVGHGIGFTMALKMLWYPMRDNHWVLADLNYALIPMLVVGSIAYGIAMYMFPSEDAAEPEPGSTVRRERFIVFGAYIGFGLLVVGAVSYRIYAREFLASYGPFSVTVDTGARPLRDIVTYLSCGRDYSEKAVLESGKSYEFPRRYSPYLSASTTCTVTPVHPALQAEFREEFTLASVKPHQRIVLPTVHPEPWTNEGYQRIVRGEEIRPGSESVSPLRRAEIKVYDDWSQLASRWMSSFCSSDVDRMKREYLPLLAERRTQLFSSNGATPPADDPRAIVLAGWQGVCSPRVAPRL